MEIQRGNWASILGTVVSPGLLEELFDLFYTKSDNFLQNLPSGIAVKWLHTLKLIIITMNTLMPYHFPKTEFRNFTIFFFVKTNQKRTRHALIGGKINQNSEFDSGNSWNHVMISVTSKPKIIHTLDFCGHLPDSSFPNHKPDPCYRYYCPGYHVFCSNWDWLNFPL